MVYVLFDDSLYVDIDGHLVVCGREEAQRKYKPRMKNMQAVFIDCIVKSVLRPSLESSFPPDYIIQHESLSGGIQQAIGALKTDVEGIYHHFKPFAPAALVPYPAVIRAFLNGRGLLPPDKACIFLDDLKTQAVLTITEGMRLSTPRKITMRDTAYLASEIQRYQKNYISQNGVGDAAREISFLLVSNNQEWLEAFCAQGLFRKEDTVHIDHPCPALEGLKNAKFNLHFALPKDVLKQKKNKVIRHYLTSALCSIGMTAVGAGLWVWTLGFQRDVTARANELKLEYEKISDDLVHVNQEKLTSYLKDGNTVDYGRLYHDFIFGVPRGYVIQGFQMKQNKGFQWQFTGIIYPGPHQAIEKTFERSGLFQRAVIEPILIQGQVGQKINLKGGKGE